MPKTYPRIEPRLSQPKQDTYHVHVIYVPHTGHAESEDTPEELEAREILWGAHTGQDRIARDLHADDDKVGYKTGLLWNEDRLFEKADLREVTCGRIEMAGRLVEITFI